MSKKIQIICAVALCLVVISILFITVDDKFLPIKEGNNAKIAYAYHNEKIGCNGSNCNPCCSMQARKWIDEYRHDYNLTHEQFLCAVWFNDMDDWFYY